MGTSWLRRRWELRRLKKAYLRARAREFYPRVHVITEQMDPAYNPPSTSLDPDATVAPMPREVAK